MKTKGATYSLIIVVVLIFIFIFQQSREPRRKEAFDRDPPSLEYTKHALCRMECRDISEEDINEIMKKGIINFGMSNRSDKPCPTFALQGETNSGEKIRIIFAQCQTETKVVTCYNLQENPSCDCPGDRR
jgi:hypothetical protein